MKSVEEIVKEILDLGDDVEITDDFKSEDEPSWDSMVQLNIISMLEDEYDVDFSVEDALEMYSVGDIKKVLKRKGVL